MPPLVFEKASVLCYRIFDIANEIDLERLRPLLTEGATRLKLSRGGSKYLQLPNPPLGVQLGKRTLALQGGGVTVEAVARLFDHGAASIILTVPVPPNLGFEDFIVLANELYESPAVDALALELVEGVRKSAAPALESSHLWDQNESYTVLFAEKIAGNPNAQEVMAQGDIARLLLGEVQVRGLSSRERADVTQAQFSYSENDLVVVDWNSAFVYEPSGSSDIPDILEICNAQLLEFRYYDDVLDGHIRHTHDSMQNHRYRWTHLFSSRYRSLARRVQVTLLEMDEFIERVENSLKIIGDFYLARVYEAAVQRLRVPNWQAAVTRKQQMLGNVYQLLKGEVDTARSLTLEFIVVILIVSELLVAGLSVYHH